MFRISLTHRGLCRLLTEIERDVSRVDSALQNPHAEREQLNVQREALRDLSSAVIRLGYVRNLQMPHARGQPAPDAAHSAAGVGFGFDAGMLGSELMRDPLDGPPRRRAPGQRSRSG